MVFLATAPFYALLMVMAVRWLRPTFYELEDAYGRYHSYQVDAIKGIETVKAVGGEPMFRQLMLAQFQRVAHKLFRADFMVMGYDGMADAVTFLGLGLFLWAGAHQVLDGQLTIGGLVAFNSLVTLATVPHLEPARCSGTASSAPRVMLNRLDDVFEHEPEQGHDRSRLRPVRSLTGHVTFRNVGFRYGGPEAPPILQDITLEVPAGKTVAIVGRSGSGKTTLAKCLAGLLEPTDGAILFDGLDLKTLNYRDLRRQIGFVLQDAYVFADSIARNIAFGEDEPDMERVRWAAQMAAADDFIERLPFGYDTRIGETGLALSGGQRQRVAIARALYGKPPILVFDEATSSLDTESERAVQREHRLAAARPHHVRHRASPQHRPARESHHRARAGPAGRAGHARGADAAPGPLLLSGQPAAGHRMTPTSPTSPISRPRSWTISRRHGRRCRWPRCCCSCSSPPSSRCSSSRCPRRLPPRSSSSRFAAPTRSGRCTPAS